MKGFIKPIILIVLLIFIIAIVSILILKYEVEGEMNMPFYLSKIMVISSAEGVQKGQTENIWDLDLLQNNDIYIEIGKNKGYNKKELIDSIVLDNFVINKKPLKGELNIYKPSEDEKNLFQITEENKVKDSITFVGSTQTDIRNLEIANQGGRIQFRCTNQNLGNYSSNEQEEIKHDGTILKKINIETKDIQAEISFDITIKLISDVQYKANITLEFPTEDLVEKGISSFEKTDMKDVIFKRI